MVLIGLLLLGVRVEYQVLVVVPLLLASSASVHIWMGISSVIGGAITIIIMKVPHVVHGRVLLLLHSPAASHEILRVALPPTHVVHHHVHAVGSGAAPVLLLLEVAVGIIGIAHVGVHVGHHVHLRHVVLVGAGGARRAVWRGRRCALVGTHICTQLVQAGN